VRLHNYGLFCVLETSLVDCVDPDAGNPVCDHNTDGGVECDVVRLADGVRLEVYVGGDWGTVCNLGLFDDLAASVACQQLGGVDGVVAQSSVPPGTGYIVLDSVQCSGNGAWRCPVCASSTRTHILYCFCRGFAVRLRAQHVGRGEPLVHSCQ
jgi:hypothetical protein